MDTGFIKFIYKKTMSLGGFIPLNVIDDGSANLTFLSAVLPETPIMYWINIINGGNAYIDNIQNILTQRKPNLMRTAQKMGCSKLVCINICVSDSADELTDIEAPDVFGDAEDFYLIWWGISPDKNKIFAAKGHPTAIRGIEKLIEEALTEYQKGLPKEKGDGLRASQERIERQTLGANYNASFLLIAVNILIFLFTIGVGETVAENFASSFNAVIAQKQYYRLITALFLHSDASHLVFNCLSLYIFGSRAETALGKKIFLATYLLAGLGGNVFTLLFSDVATIGASGAICGVMGACIAISVANRYGFVGGVSYTTLILLAITGMAAGFAMPRVNNIAHIAGFLIGLSFNFILLKGYKRR